MSDILGFPHDHAQVAWNNFLAQHIGKANTEGFVTAFYPPINLLDNALSGLYTDRWIETSEGKQLDGVGSIVGQPRRIANSVYIAYFGFKSQISGRSFGVAKIRRQREPWAESSLLGDEDYRTAIRLKIALNNGHGTAEELIYAFNTSLKVTRTRVDDLGNGNAKVYINDFISQNDIRFVLIGTSVPKAAGVKLWPYFVDADHTFGFANQKLYFGFEVGVLARSFLSNIPPIPESLSTWDNSESIWDVGQSTWDVFGPDTPA